MCNKVTSSVKPNQGENSVGFLENLETCKLVKKKVDPRYMTKHHYTDFIGLKGILESKNLWLTHYSDLNDLSETKYVIFVLKKIVDDFTTKKKESEKILRFFLDTLNKITYGIYVFSACEESNYLPCLRFYADEAAGFSIGIDFSEIDLKETTDYQVSFREVIYDEAYYQKGIENDIQKLISVPIGDLSPDRVVDKCSRLASCILALSPFIKHPCFKEEKEYRLIIRDNNSEEIQGGKIPTEFLFKRDKPKKSKFCNPIRSAWISIPPTAIKHILVGPRCDFEMAEEEIKKLLINNGYDLKRIQIEKSDLPFVDQGRR